MKRKNNLNVKLSDEEKRRLKVICYVNSSTITDIIVNAINKEYKNIFS